MPYHATHALELLRLGTQNATAAFRDGQEAAIQHVVEEMAAADLKKVLFVTSRSKNIIENQFDNNVDVVIHLEQNQRLQDCTI